VEGGVMAAFRREIEAAPDPRQRENEIEQELRQLTSPYRMAEAFAIEEIIDPLETRPYLYDVLEAARVGMPAKLGRKPRYGVRP
jgi:acetyl-CoA carboxylase carboxyltransferase component